MRKLTDLTLATCLVALCALGGCKSDDAQFALRRVAADSVGGGDAAISPDGTRFVTSSRRSGNWDVWIYDLRTQQWTPATDDAADDFEAQWSRDATQLVFTSTRSGNKDVWVLSLEDGSVRQITNSPDDEEYPAWSPSGDSIVYTGGPWQARAFFMVSASGGTPRNVTGESGHEGACSFAPSGQSLICHTYRSGDGDVVEWKLDARKWETITSGEPWDYKPRVSPDGKWIAFSRSMDGPSNIWVMRRDGDAAQPLVAGLDDDRWPNWTADSDRLFFHRLVDDGTAVRTLDRATGEIRTLVGPEERPQQASFDPLGQRVVYCARIDGRHALRIVTLQSGQIQTLRTKYREACFPRWSPDGQRIAFVGKNDGAHWELATVQPDGSRLVSLRRQAPELRGLFGPIDWSPDGTRIVFKADTGPFQSDLFIADTRTQSIRKLTNDVWFDEAPSWTPDGQGVLFMSTRGGDWTWGLFRISIADGSVQVIAQPDYTEKNFPRMSPERQIVWSAFGEDGIERIVEQPSPGTREPRIVAGPWARWPSFSPDGRQLLFTTRQHYVEYWIAEHLQSSRSPLLQRLAENPAQGKVCAVRTASTLGWTAEAIRKLRRSPASLHHR